MINKKNIIKIIAGILILFIIIEICMSVYLSLKAKHIVETIYNHYGVWSDELNEELNGTVPKELIWQINYREYGSFIYHEDEWNSYDEWKNSWYDGLNECGPFITIWFFNKAKVYYKYSYEAKEVSTNKRVYGSWEVPCSITFELKDWKWIVTKYHEDP